MSILHDSRELSSENVMPQQPRTAFFTPSKNITAKSVFEALANTEIDAAEIACLQRLMNGEVTVTFKSISPRRNSSDTIRYKCSSLW